MQPEQRCSYGLGALAILLGVGCSDSDGADAPKYTDTHPLNTIRASYGAFADEGSLRIYAAVLGDDGFLRLRGGDAIEVDVNGARVATRERILEDKVHYIVEMSPPAQDTEVTITFARGAERVVAKTKLFGAFAVKDPPASIKRTERVTLDIDPRPDLSKWMGGFGSTLNAKAEISGTCLEPAAQQIDLCAADSTPGQCKAGFPLTLDATKITTRADAKACELAVQLRMVSSAKPLEGTGPAKESFKGGGIDGHRLRSFKAQLTE